MKGTRLLDVLCVVWYVVIFLGERNGGRIRRARIEKRKERTGGLERGPEMDRLGKVQAAAVQGVKFE